MVRVDDYVHVGDRGYGHVVRIVATGVKPILVKYDHGGEAWEYESHITVLRPEVGRQDIELTPKTLEILISGFDTYARHRFFECIENDPGVCSCGYTRVKAQVNDIRKMVGL